MNAGLSSLVVWLFCKY